MSVFTEVQHAKKFINGPMTVIGMADYHGSYSENIGRSSVKVLVCEAHDLYVLVDSMSRLPLMTLKDGEKPNPDDVYGPPALPLAKLNKDFHHYDESFNTRLLYAYEEELRKEGVTGKLTPKQCKQILSQLSEALDTPIHFNKVRKNNNTLATTRVQRSGGTFSKADSFEIDFNVYNSKHFNYLLVIHEVSHILDYYWTRSVGHTPSFLFLYGKLMSRITGHLYLSKFRKRGLIMGNYGRFGDEELFEFYNDSNIEKVLDLKGIL